MRFHPPQTVPKGQVSTISALGYGRMTKVYYHPRRERAQRDTTTGLGSSTRSFQRGFQ